LTKAFVPPTPRPGDVNVVIDQFFRIDVVEARLIRSDDFVLSFESSSSGCFVNAPPME
jgi:hypothetical protein